MLFRSFSRWRPGPERATDSLSLTQHVDGRAQTRPPHPREGKGAADCCHRWGASGTWPLPVSQRGPSKGSEQRQVKFPTRSTHDPPFRQGSEPHSSTSGGGRGGCSALCQPLATWHPAPLLPPEGTLTRLAGCARVAGCARAHRRAAPRLTPAAVLALSGVTWRLRYKPRGVEGHWIPGCGGPRGSRSAPFLTSRAAARVDLAV